MSEKVQKTWFEEMFEEGVKVGEDAGVKKGEIISLRNTLLQILRKRFPAIALSPELLQRIQSLTSEAILRRAIDDALDIQDPNHLNLNP